MFNLNPSKNSIKWRFILWLVAVSIILLCFVRLMITGFSLNTNMLDLLPQTASNPIVQQATNIISKKLTHKIIFLVSNSDQQLTNNAADMLYNSLETSQLFSNIHYRVGTNQQQQWGKFYFKYRLNLLTPQQRSLLKNNNTERLFNNALIKLYSPIAVSNSTLLETDPLFMFQDFITSLPKPASNVTLIDKRMMVHKSDQWYVMLTASLKTDSFSIANQNKVAQLMSRLHKQIPQRFAETKLLASGVVFYAKAGTDAARKDISTIGIGSLIGIILLVLLTFRSSKPLFFTLLSGAIGFIAAIVITHVIFSSLYLFTLVFGISIIGITVDYAFFYYTEQLCGGTNWQSSIGLRNIFPGISLGLINIIIAYVVIASTPFPGLKQLAVFSISGLIFAYATVVCLFPMVLSAKQNPHQPLALRYSNHYLHFWQRLSNKKIILLFIPIVFFISIGLMQVKTNDDVHILESTPTYLKSTENTIKRIIGNPFGISFFVVKGHSPQQVLNHESRLTALLADTFPHITQPFLAMNTYLPSITTQKSNYSLIHKKIFTAKLVTYLDRIGVSHNKAITITNHLKAIPFSAMTVNDWISSPVSQSLRFLWLGKIDNEYVSIVLPSAQLANMQLHAIAEQQANVHYVNKAEQISTLFKLYRHIISSLLIVAYGLLLLLLFLRYTLKQALLYLLPPVSAALISLALFGWFNIPLTLFSLLALVLLLGVSVDYVLFFAETRSNFNNTMLAVSLSAITTTLSFGLLAFSATPVIHYFGLTMLIGISSAFLLSPLATRLAASKKGTTDE